jgi:hypothetical protein
VIPGQALSGWLNDRRAQDATLERLVDARRAWQSSGDLAGLESRLDAAASDPALVAGIANDILKDDRLARLFLETMIAGLSADPFFTPPLRHMPGTIGDGVRLFSHRDLNVSLVVIDADSLAAKKRAGSGGRSLVFAGHVALRRILRAGGAAIQLFEAEPAGQEFCLAEQAPCRPGRRERLGDGDLLSIDGRRETFTFLHAHSAIAYLECEILAGGAPFRVEYDAETLEPVAASSTDAASSRCQMMLSALRALDGPAETSLYDALLDDRSFEVRWHAMRELMLVDSRTAWPRLRRLAASDSHREVRAAAARTVAAQARGGVPCRA